MGMGLRYCPIMAVYRRPRRRVVLDKEAPVQLKVHRMELTKDMVEKAVDLVEAGMDKSAIEKDIATSVKVTTRLLLHVHLCVP